MKYCLMIAFIFAYANIAVAQTKVKNKLQEIQCSYEEFVDVIRLTQGISDFTQEQEKNIHDQYQLQVDYGKLLIAKANKLGVTVTNEEMRKVLEDGTDPVLKLSPFVNKSTGKFDMAMVNKFLDEYHKKKNTSDAKSYNRIYKYWSYLGKTIRQTKLKEKVVETIKKNGEIFLIKNRNALGIKELPSGVQYKVLKKGNGEIAGENSVVKVNYEEKTLDGDMIKSTYSSGGALEVQTMYQYQGMKDVIMHMPVGSIWEVYIPQQLAYGTNGLWSYSLIIMKIELISIIDNDYSLK